MAVSDWDQRALCPDGACVGVIGPDGTCKVCGRVAPNWGDERNRGLLVPETDAPDDEPVDDEDDDDGDDLDDDEDGDEEDEDGLDEDGDEEDEDGLDEDDEPDPEAPGRTTASDWTARELCENGACTGVIGDNGLCKVCGRAAEAR